MQHHMHAGVEIDMDEVKVPLTRDRLLGLQQELHDALDEDSFQERLCECERALGKGTREFRKQHQQLVLEVQAAILPKYGFEPSLQGVADMLAAVQTYAGDPEVTANIKAIDALIWKPHHALHHAHEAHGMAALDAPPGLDWLQRWEDTAHEEPEDEFDGKHHAGVEIDMDSVEVPLTRERVLGLQSELRERLAAGDVQARLRACERGHHGGQGLEHRKEHQKIVLDVQAEVLPKYGFEGSLDGVHDMMAAVKTFSKDEEVAANLRAIDQLIWRSGAAPDAKARPHKREV